MGHGRYSVADIEKMLLACADGARIIQRGHHYWAVRGERRYTQLPKGTGPKGQPKHQLRVEDGHVRSLVRVLDIDVECAKRHLSLAWS